MEDSRVCDVRNGVLKGIENGTTRVKGVFDGKEKELQVTVEIGEGTQIVESFDDASVFQLKTIGASNLSFSNEGLPAAWKHGLVMNFEFSSGRGPYIELSKEICFYGLPDSISLNLKNDDGIISGIDFYLENAADESMTQRLSLQPNGEQLVVVPFMKDGKMWDIRNFPIILRKIKMTLKPGVDGKKYQVPIGNLRAHYPEGMTKVTDVLKNNPFNIYASASALTVDYTLTETSNIRMALHSIDGKTVRSISKHQLFAGLYRENINIAALPSGVYILKIFVNGTEYSQKIRKR